MTWGPGCGCAHGPGRRGRRHHRCGLAGSGPAASARPGLAWTGRAPGRQPPARRGRAGCGRRRRPAAISRTPFILFVTALLGGGLVCLLVINTILAAGAYQITSLQQSQTTQAQQVQVLRQQVAADSAPSVIAPPGPRTGHGGAAADQFRQPQDRPDRPPADHPARRARRTRDTPRERRPGRGATRSQGAGGGRRPRPARPGPGRAAPVPAAVMPGAAARQRPGPAQRPATGPAGRQRPRRARRGPGGAGPARDAAARGGTRAGAGGPGWARRRGAAAQPGRAARAAAPAPRGHSPQAPAPPPGAPAPAGPRQSGPPAAHHHALHGLRAVPGGRAAGPAAGHGGPRRTRPRPITSG